MWALQKSLLFCLVSMIVAGCCSSNNFDFPNRHKYLKGDLKLPTNLDGRTYELGSTPVYAVFRNGKFEYLHRNFGEDFTGIRPDEIFAGKQYVICYVDASVSWKIIGSLFSDIKGSGIDKVFIAYDDEWGGSSKNAYFLVRACAKRDGSVELKLLESGSVKEDNLSGNLVYSSVNDPGVLGRVAKLSKQDKSVGVFLIADDNISIGEYLKFYQLMGKVGGKKIYYPQAQGQSRNLAIPAVEAPPRGAEDGGGSQPSP